MSNPAKKQKLQSWKAIARYLNRSVRTVRRWEQSENLPVHRHMHQAQATVYAYPEELDRWQQQRSETSSRTSQQETPGSNMSIRQQQPGTSIVVMPMGFAGADPLQSWVAQGISEELINSLSALNDLRVISRTSSLSLDQDRQSARAIGKNLDVSHLLEGSVVSDGKNLRVAVSLIDTHNDHRLWSKRFDGAMADVFDVLERLSREVVDALRIQLSTLENQQLSVRPIHNPDAWQKLVLARQQSFRWREDAIEQAVTLLEEAIELEGENAVLYAAMGRTLLQYREAGICSDDALLEKAQVFEQRASTLGPDAAEVLQLRGWIEYVNGNLNGTINELEQALEKSPSNADTLGLLANCCLLTGRMGRANAVIKRLLKVDPLTPISQCVPGWASALAGEFRQALGPYRSMFENDPGNPFARLFYLWILTLNERKPDVAHLIETAPHGFTESAPGLIANQLSNALHGLPINSDLTPERFPAASMNEMFPRLLAEAHALAGEPDIALQWLEIAVDKGFSNYPYLAEHNRLFRPYREHTGWSELLQRVRRSWLENTQRAAG